MVEEIESIMGERASRRFGELRGVQWRIDLGILPSNPLASVDDLRRVTANSRRRYAALRRQLLVDPQVPKDGSSSPENVMDNPLSQDPDSMWGRFFRNAELERMVDQDMTRLYPERVGYFQTGSCQGILRRILLLWCLRHPEYGYRQGLHELLAPLLYVLHVDVERLSEVREVHDVHFADKFDGFSFHENDLTYKFDFKKFSDTEEYWNGFDKSSTKTRTVGEIDPEVQTIVLLCDAYGAEGELGILMSEKFMEHDTYSMFDALMSGAGGAIAMADFYSPSPFKSSHTGFPPVIEASAAVYHLLSIVDSSLHSHLVELGVEPQYFALRWLRLLFGREFSLEHLLIIWDEIFARDNTKSNEAAKGDVESNFGVLESSRGAFITAFAVSMILNLRSSLLATENATACLQRLLRFPDEVKLTKLISKAKSLEDMAIDANKSNSLPIHLWGGKSVTTRSHSLSLDSTSPRTPLNIVPESYWEEKWRVLHKENEHKQGAAGKQVPDRKKGWSEKIKQRLSRTESDPSPLKNNERTKISKPPVRRSLLQDLERQLGSDEDKDDASCDQEVGKLDPVDSNEQDVTDKDTAGSGENSSNFLDPPSSSEGNSNHENESGRSSVASNSSIEENDTESENDRECSPLPISDFQDGPSPKSSESSSVASNLCNNENDTEYSNANSCITNPDCSPPPISDPHDDPSSKPLQNDDFKGKLAAGMKEVKHLSGKFQWLWKLGRNSNDRMPERISLPDDAKACNGEGSQNDFPRANGCDVTSVKSKGETVDQNVMVSIKNLGQSVLENIQVIESVFQQDWDFSKNGFVGKGQVTAISALKELRKISNLLSEM